MKRIAGLFAAAAVVGLVATLPTAAQEGEGATPTAFPIKKPPLQRWSFAGIFGTFDTAQLQRGFQVYKEVCSSCHSMDLVAFRNLGAGRRTAFHRGPGQGAGRLLHGHRRTQ